MAGYLVLTRTVTVELVDTKIIDIISTWHLSPWSAIPTANLLMVSLDPLMTSVVSNRVWLPRQLRRRRRRRRHRMLNVAGKVPKAR